MHNKDFPLIKILLKSFFFFFTAELQTSLMLQFFCTILLIPSILRFYTYSYFWLTQMHCSEFDWFVTFQWLAQRYLVFFFLESKCCWGMLSLSSGHCSRNVLPKKKQFFVLWPIYGWLQFLCFGNPFLYRQLNVLISFTRFGHCFQSTRNIYISQIKYKHIDFIHFPISLNY